jgi:hypothetical protein
LLGSASSDTSSAQRSGLTGARDEQSVLFSLSALTSGAKSAPPPASSPALISAPSTSSRSEDSGLIDLNALAKSQLAAKAAEEASPLSGPTPFLFPPTLGTVEPFQPEAMKKKSMMPMVIGGGFLLLAVIGAFALFGKKDETVSPSVAAALSAPVATAEPAPAPPPAEPAPADSAAAVASAKAATPKKGGGGARAAKPPAGGAAPGPATPLPTPPPKPRSPCGCAASDLQCQIRCSAVGK